MNELLDELLDFNRATLNLGFSLNSTHCDLAAACLDEVELRRVAHPDHRIGWTSSGSAVGVWDASRVRQALGNFIANAAKHGDRHSPIEVELRGTADEVCIAVSNRGAAIGPDVIDAIFDPLRSAADSAADDKTHMGLGLFVVREIAKAHGGRVAVDSSPSQTRFSLHLPRSR